VIGRAFRWREMLQNGTTATISEIAGRDGQCVQSQAAPAPNSAGPDIVEAILVGRQMEMTLAELMQPFPVGWREQRKAPGFAYGSRDAVSLQR